MNRPMIGKSLNERFGARRMLPADRAVEILRGVLDAQAPYIVRVRSADPRMIACVIVDADDAAVRTCKSFGLAMEKGGDGVLGLLGADAARVFPELAGAEPRAWLEAPCAERETKVLLVAGGLGLLSIETRDGKVTVTAA